MNSEVQSKNGCVLKAASWEGMAQTTASSNGMAKNRHDFEYMSDRRIED